MAEPIPAPRELSPELVLVMPPELRAQAIAALGPPLWPVPPRPLVIAPPPPPPPAEPPRLLQAAAIRLVPLAALFLVATTLTLVLTLAANATR